MCNFFKPPTNPETTIIIFTYKETCQQPTS